MKAWLETTRWRDAYELRIGGHYGKFTQYAEAVGEDGSIVWKTTDESSEIPVFMVLTREVVEALAKELGTHIPETDATVAALVDARAVRDRLLTLVERGWEQP